MTSHAYKLIVLLLQVLTSQAHLHRGRRGHNSPLYHPILSAHRFLVAVPLFHYTLSTTQKPPTFGHVIRLEPKIHMMPEWEAKVCRH